MTHLQYTHEDLLRGGEVGVLEAGGFIEEVQYLLVKDYYHHMSAGP